MVKTTSPKAHMKFTKDEFGKEILLKDESLQVMMEWEKPYMEACIDTLKPEGDVLEIGFGLGYSACCIQKHNPRSHTIIECDPEVITQAKKWAKKHSNVQIVEGTWQEMLGKLGVFDVIFFDDYSPLSPEEVNQMQQDSSKCQEASDEMQKLKEAISENLKRYTGIKFSDQELQAFGKQMQTRRDVTPRDVSDFINTLVEMGNITTSQRDSFIKSTGAKPKAILPSKTEEQTVSWINTKAAQGDRFIDFTALCLDKHMHSKSRLSAYMGSSESKKEHPEFKKRILSRKDVEYKEKLIPIKVPTNCQYFQGDKALVIVISKK